MLMDKNMMDNATRDFIDRQTMTIRFTVGALCMGLVTFAVVVLMMRQPNFQGPGMMTFMSVAFAAINTLIAMVLPRHIANSRRRQMASDSWQVCGSSNLYGNAQGQNVPRLDTDGSKLSVVFQTKTVIGCALLEGSAFFLLTAFMTEGHFSVLVVAAVMLIGIAAHFPLPGQLANWVEDQLRVMEDEKQLSGQTNRDRFS